MSERRVFSGIQPTGRKHLGNYIGAIRHYVESQERAAERDAAIFCIVDLHAITVDYDPGELRERVHDTAAVLLAAGLDPERCILFRQGDVREHTELAWLLQAVTAWGDLNRMHQWKAKREQLEARPGAFVSAGIFNYPILQAADVLAYRATEVPVGEDQRQHIELMREVARRFNERFGDTLVEPADVVPGVGARIMDLQDPTAKMSTTGGSEAGTVYVLDEPDAIRKKVRSAQTDSGREVRRGEGKEGIANLIDVLSVVRDVEPAAVEAEFEGSGYGDFKAAVGDAVAEYLTPVRERYAELRDDPDELERALAAGADRAREIAAGTLAEVRERMGVAEPRTMKIPETRYADSSGISIAYQVHGEGPLDLVFAGTTASNVETVWQLPEAVRFLERLGRFARVIRFDRRDTGISDPVKEDLTLEAHAADALAVMDAVDSERPFLLGGIEAARSLAVLAATTPERTAGLIAICPSAGGSAVSAPEVADEVAAAVTDLTWPDSVIDVWAPSLTSDPVRRSRVARYIRTAATPIQVQRLLRLSLTSNVADVLPLVQAPTLVLRPADAQMPEAPQREFADLIEGSVYEEIPGDAVFIYGLDVDLLASRIEAFVTGTAPRPATDRVLATILFTDLVSSTERAAELGDREWTAVLERHIGAARASVSMHGGESVKSLGDGLLATFTGPAQAVRCASQVVAEARAMGLDVRAGVHTGEVARSGDDVAGLAVHIAARIMGEAEVGEVLVSRTVRDLVVGSELSFADRGERDLKGVPEAWRVYATA